MRGAIGHSAMCNQRSRLEVNHTAAHSLTTFSWDFYFQCFTPETSFQLPDPPIFPGLRGCSAFPPKRCFCSLFRFVFPAIVECLSDPISPAGLRDVASLHPFLHNLPFLFRGSIYAWFPAHAASCVEALNHTEFGSLVSAGSTTILSLSSPSSLVECVRMASDAHWDCA
jgi:hypothetical protein